MVYLLGATVAALRLGRGPASFAAVANVVALDFCFVPPRFTFAVSNLQYLVTFAVMLVLALVIANLVANVRAQTRVAGARERRTSLLYAMSRELAATRSFDNLARVAIKHVAETFSRRAAVLLPDAEGHLRARRGLDPRSFARGRRSVGRPMGVRSRPAGGARHRYAARGAGAVPAAHRHAAARSACSPFSPTQRRRLLLPEQRHLLETFAGQIALAIERAQRAEEAEAARVAVETESLRNSLLASISHDLRTPLAAIMAASHALNDPGIQPDRRDPRAARPLDRNQRAGDVRAHLQRARSDEFQFGEVHLQPRLARRRDLVESAARATRRPARASIRVDVALPADLPPVNVDAALVTRVSGQPPRERVKHTPPGTRITISRRTRGRRGAHRRRRQRPRAAARAAGAAVRQIPARPTIEADVGGAGLGLAICRAIVNAHGGQSRPCSGRAAARDSCSRYPPWRAHRRASGSKGATI